METHSAEFIKEMTSRLDDEKQSLEQELGSIGKKDGVGFPQYGRNDEDNATEIGDYAATAATETALKQRLKEIEEALERVAADTYGVTDDGELIPEARLRANPAATTTIKRAET